MTVLQTQSRLPGSPLGWLPFLEQLVDTLRLAWRRRQAERALRRRAALANKDLCVDADGAAAAHARQAAREEEVRAAWLLLDDRRNPFRWY